MRLNRQKCIATVLFLGSATVVPGAGAQTATPPVPDPGAPAAPSEPTSQTVPPSSTPSSPSATPTAAAEQPPPTVVAPNGAPPPVAYDNAPAGPPPPPPQNAPPPPYYGGAPIEPPPPPPPPAEEGVHEHDGLFMRLGIGYAHLKTSMRETEPVSADQGTVSGGGVGISLMLGGTPAKGFVLGGALISHAVSEPTYEQSGQETTLDGGTMTLGTLALFGQYYFDPKEGGYLQALFGYGQSDVYSDNSSDDREKPDGVIFGVGGGYDFWVSDQWSLGPELRIMYAPLKYDRDGLRGDFNTTAISLFFTGTYH